MLKNDFKIALRILQRQKTYSLINVSGLAVGLACCILIFAFVRREVTYDRFHEHAAQIYRVYKVEKRTDGTRRQATLPPPLAPILKEEAPGAEQVVRLFKPFNEAIKPVRYGDTWLEEEIHFADPAFLTVFSFPLRQGDPATALRAPNAVVLSERAAATYFGSDEPLGQHLSIRIGGEDQDFVVTGVAERIPEHSSIQFEILLNYQKVKDEVAPFFGEAALESWNFFTEIYVQLGAEISPAAVEAHFPTLVDMHLADQVQQWKGRGRLVDEDDAFQLRLQPLPAIHLSPDVESSITIASNPVYAYLLSGMALLLLLLACINFTTLSVGRSVSRAHEVGVRKVLGALRVQLLKQYLGQALLLSLLALVLGVLLALLLLPTFNSLADLHLSIASFMDGGMLFALVGLLLLSGLLAGSYPAVFLSRLEPARVLKGMVPFGGKKRFIRGLVVFQFVLSIGFLIGTLVMARQVDYLRAKDLGFDKEHVVVIATHLKGPESARLLERYKEALAAHPGIVNVSGSDGSFARTSLSLSIHLEDKNVSVPLYRVDYEYLQTLGIELVEGRNFSKEIATDQENVVLINEHLARLLEWDDPVGKDVPIGFPSKTVIGVIKDYHIEPLHQVIKPVVLHIHPGRPVSYLFVRLRPGAIPETLVHLRQAWRAVAPASPFTYAFLDQEVDRHYRTEARWGHIVRYASILAMLVSCLGLFGLATLTVTGRMREVGIRKVLGASAEKVVVLISKEFVVLVGIAFAFAAPLAYVVMNRWLDTFAYHIDIGLNAFLIVGIGACVVAWLTVSYQAIRAALTDPVETLRYE